MKIIQIYALGQDSSVPVPCMFSIRQQTYEEEPRSRTPAQYIGTSSKVKVPLEINYARLIKTI
jgi:hypothetical protein